MQYQVKYFIEGFYMNIIMVINKIGNLIHKKVILTGSDFPKPTLIGIN